MWVPCNGWCYLTHKCTGHLVLQQRQTHLVPKDIQNMVSFFNMRVNSPSSLSGLKSQQILRLVTANWKLICSMRWWDAKMAPSLPPVMPCHILWYLLHWETQSSSCLKQFMRAINLNSMILNSWKLPIFETVRIKSLPWDTRDWRRFFILM